MAVAVGKNSGRPWNLGYSIFRKITSFVNTTWSTLVKNMVKCGQQPHATIQRQFCGASIFHPRHINKEESTTEIFPADHPTIGDESLRCEQRRLQGWSRFRGLFEGTKQKNCGQR